MRAALFRGAGGRRPGRGAVLAAAALALRLCGPAAAAAQETPPPAAEPEAPTRLRVVRGAPPGLWEGVRSAAARAARRLWQREEPSAVRGNALLASGDPPGAVEAYDEAEKAVPASGEAPAALAHDRATALLHQGPQQAPRALEESHRALEGPDGAVRALGAYDAALALESMGDPAQAIAAYGRALALDADDEDAKVNLELLLREEERKKRQPSPQGSPQDSKEPQKPGDDPRGKAPSPSAQGEKNGAGQPQGPQPQDNKGPDKGGPDPRAKAQEDPAQKPPDAPAPPKPGGESKAEGGSEGGHAAAGRDREAGRSAPQPQDLREAQRLLDALRAGEKNLQTWRFGKRVRDAQRSHAEKDW